MVSVSSVQSSKPLLNVLLQRSHIRHIDKSVKHHASPRRALRRVQYGRHDTVQMISEWCSL